MAWLAFTLAGQHAYTYACATLMNRQNQDAGSGSPPGDTEPLSLIDGGWSHPLNNSGATDVSGREMSPISSAALGLKHHSGDKTIYLGHGSLASGTQKLPNHRGIYLHLYTLQSFSLSCSASLSLCPRLNLLFGKPLRTSAFDRRCAQAVRMEMRVRFSPNNTHKVKERVSRGRLG